MNFDNKVFHKIVSNPRDSNALTTLSFSDLPSVYNFHQYMNNLKKTESKKLDYFHSSYLKTKGEKYLHMNTNFFLTSNSDWKDSSIKTLPSKLDHTHFARSTSSKNTKKLDISNIKDKYNKTGHYISFFSRDPPAHQRNSRYFMTNVNSVRKAHLFLMYQREQLNSLNEMKERIEDRINEIKSSNTKNVIYFNEYLVNLGNYVRYLNREKEKEKKRDQDLCNFKDKLEEQKRGLQNDIQKIERNLNWLKNIKYFLLKVKYKVRNLSHIPINDQRQYGLIQETRNSLHIPNYSKGRETKKTNKRNSFQNNSPINFNKHLNQKLKLVHLSSSELPKDNIINKISKDSNYSNPIFSCPEEFWNIINNLENSSFKLLTSIEDQTEENKLLLEEKYHEEKFHIKLEKEENEFFIIIENDLEKLKKKNKELIQMFNYAQKTEKKRMGRIENKIKAMVLKLPVDLCEFSGDDMIYSKLMSKDDSVLVDGMKYNKVIYSIKLLEKMLVHYRMQVHKMVNEPRMGKFFLMFKNRIEREKKREKNRENMVNQIYAKERRNKTVLEKQNKIYIREKRKVKEPPVNKMNMTTMNKRKMKVTSNDIKNYNYISFLTY